jgi:hypothetical protein
VWWVLQLCNALTSDVCMPAASFVSSCSTSKYISSCHAKMRTAQHSRSCSAGIRCHSTCHILSLHMPQAGQSSLHTDVVSPSGLQLRCAAAKDKDCKGRTHSHHHHHACQPAHVPSANQPPAWLLPALLALQPCPVGSYTADTDATSKDACI